MYSLLKELVNSAPILGTETLFALVISFSLASVALSFNISSEFRARLRGIDAILDVNPKLHTISTLAVNPISHTHIYI